MTYKADGEFQACRWTVEPIENVFSKFNFIRYERSYKVDSYSIFQLIPTFAHSNVHHYKSYG